jgi:hypothetical protein
MSNLSCGLVQTADSIASVAHDPSISIRVPRSDGIISVQPGIRPGQPVSRNQEADFFDEKKESSILDPICPEGTSMRRADLQVFDAGFRSEVNQFDSQSLYSVQILQHVLSKLKALLRDHTQQHLMMCQSVTEPGAYKQGAPASYPLCPGNQRDSALQRFLMEADTEISTHRRGIPPVPHHPTAAVLHCSRPR